MAISNWSKAIGAALALFLAACGSNAPEEGGGTQTAEAPATPDTTEVPVMGPEKRILAFGDSLTAGYGVDPQDSYPSKLQNALRARGINARVTNAGVSGDTSAAGLQRIAFTLDAQAEKPDLVLVELGGNDLLRGLPVEETRNNIDAILSEIRGRHIDAVVMGMRSPPNYGPEYTAAFDGLYPDLAAKHGADLVPFFLEAVYQDPGLFQSDRVHPTSEGIELIVEDTVDEVEAALD